MWCIYMLIMGVVLWRKCACFSVKELELVVVNWLLGGDQAEGWGCRHVVMDGSGRLDDCSCSARGVHKTHAPAARAAWISMELGL